MQQHSSFYKNLGLAELITDVSKWNKFSLKGQTKYKQHKMYSLSDCVG